MFCFNFKKTNSSGYKNVKCVENFNMMNTQSIKISCRKVENGEFFFDWDYTNKRILLCYS